MNQVPSSSSCHLGRSSSSSPWSSLNPWSFSSSPWSPFRVRVRLVQGSGFRVQGSGFRVQGSGFRVQGPGFRVHDSGFRVSRFGFRVSSSGSRVSGFALGELLVSQSSLGSRVLGRVVMLRDIVTRFVYERRTFG